MESAIHILQMAYSATVLCGLLCGPAFAVHSELCWLVGGLEWDEGGRVQGKMRERDRVTIYYAVISNLIIMAYIPVRAADSVLQVIRQVLSGQRAGGPRFHW